MTRSILFGVSVRRTSSEAGIDRMVISIDEVKDQDGNDLPESWKRILLFSKPESITDAVSIEECTMIGYAPVERFNEVKKKTYGTSSPADWDSLPEAVPVLTPELDVEDATVPSDAYLGQYVNDRLITSSVMVLRGSYSTLATLKESFFENLKDIKDRYAVYVNDFSTVTDISLYPTGWEAYEL